VVWWRFAAGHGEGSTEGRKEAELSKKAIWLGMFVGSTIGGSVPLLWHASMFSVSSVFLSAVGALAGIWGAYKLTR
jgi:hypothetical protein